MKIVTFFAAMFFAIQVLGLNADKKVSPYELNHMDHINGSKIKIEGYLGTKIDLCIEKRVENADVDHFVEPFRHKNETRLWQTEFWGKWMLAATSSYKYNQDPELLKTIRNAVAALLQTQDKNGYIGNYTDDAQLQHWDIWGRKYTLLGLLAYYDISGEKNVLLVAEKLADHLLSQVGPGKTNIILTGNYRGMPSSSILEPIILLYQRTGDEKYLDFAKYIVEQWETADGPGLLSKSFENVAVYNRFPQPKIWWSWDNGQKAYEMMSCYEGLLELYTITRNPSYFKAVEMVVENIIQNEINIAGSGTAFECWYNGKSKQTTPAYHTMETCVTMTWMKLCNTMLKLTGNPKYADQIEISLYNALMASLKYDGEQIAKYSPLEGIRHEGEEQCGMHINCCNANGPRAFAMIPNMAIMGAGSSIYLNIFGNIQSDLVLPSKNKIEIKMETDYPVSGHIKLKVNTKFAEKFKLAIRIPGWSKKSDIQLNETKLTNISAGRYFEIEKNWNNDVVTIELDMTGQIELHNGFQAIRRGPVVLARDARLNDGDVDESAVVFQTKGNVDLIAESEKPDDVWMVFKAPLVLGTDLEGEFRLPRQVRFCDFASAGNIWSQKARYRVWIPQTLNVMGTDYSTY